MAKKQPITSKKKSSQSLKVKHSYKKHLLLYAYRKNRKNKLNQLATENINPSFKQKFTASTYTFKRFKRQSIFWSKYYLSQTLSKNKKQTAQSVHKPAKQTKRATLFVVPQKIQKNVLFKGTWFITKPFVKTVQLYPVQSTIAIVMSLGIFGTTYYTHELIFKDLPQAADLIKQDQSITTRILDRNGNLLYRIYEDENRTLVPLSQISPHLINATIAIEDKDFYHHHGFSPKGIIRAFISNSRSETVQGGSTITQQLVKNRLLSPERTITRKIKELILAILVEGTYTKEQILEMYFNQVAYGGATYGVEEAAYRYFDKPAKELSLAESALLAGLPAAPSVYSPFGAKPEFAYARQEEVLRRMVEDNMITPEEAKKALNTKLAFREDVIDIQAPHFVMYVREILAQEYGEDFIANGGLEVRTTLDLQLQNEAQKIVTDEITNLERLRVSNGASLITNPNTGEILAMVGSKNYFDFANDGQVNVVLRERQPGSSIKPLTYAIALERGSTLNSIISDTPITYNIAGSPPYSPKNYDGKFHGNVTLKESLASSYNIPAVKMLAAVGLESMIARGTEMGISTWKNPSRYGLSLTLGGGEVLMLDMSKLYGVFASGGKVTDLNPIIEIKDSTGKVLYQNDCALHNTDCPSKQVLDSRVAFLISEALSSNEARSPAFGPQSTLYIPNQQVAVKTGTTNNLRDNWTIGYTQDYVVSVWVGNNDNTPMSYVASGVTGASPIWNNLIRLLLDEKNPHTFDVPSGVVRVATCAKTGTLPCASCKGTEEYYIVGTAPNTRCSNQFFARDELRNKEVSQSRRVREVLN